MDTAARGQLGGLDMSRAARERLAVESQSFRCQVCGKTNLEILQASEERATKKTTTTTEVEVPAELRMAWRDELASERQQQSIEQQAAQQSKQQSAQQCIEQQAAQQSKQQAAQQSEQQAAQSAAPHCPPRTGSPDSETAELAEGFVSTRPTPADNPAQSQPEHPPQGLASTQTQTQTHTQTQTQTQTHTLRQLPAEGVPSWLDRAIVGLLVALVGMILKMLLS